MTSFTKITAALLAASVISTGAAQAATTAAGQINATVVGPLSIVQTTPLSFGSISVGASGGTVTSFGTTTGGVDYLSGATPALFTVTGTPNSNFNLKGPSAVNIFKGTDKMVAFITIPGVSVFDSTGRREVNVTGKLNVAGNQPAGTYSGTYNVSVHY